MDFFSQELCYGIEKHIEEKVVQEISYYLVKCVPLKHINHIGSKFISLKLLLLLSTDQKFIDLRTYLIDIRFNHWKFIVTSVTINEIPFSFLSLTFSSLSSFGTLGLFDTFVSRRSSQANHPIKNNLDLIVEWTLVNLFQLIWFHHLNLLRVA